MSITAISGPYVQFPEGAQTGTSPGQNPEAGPALFSHGYAIMDLRPPYVYVPGQNFGDQTCGWISLDCQTLDEVPYTATTSNIAAAQTATAGTALTLVSVSATGIVAGVTITSALTGQIVTGLLAINSQMTTVVYGSAGTIQVWDPTTAISRNVTISSNASDSAGTYTVRGYDIYSFPLTETITGANGSTAAYTLAAGAKAFKYIASVTPAGTVSSTGVIVGVGDTIGLPLRADRSGELSVILGNTAIVASTGFTAAVTTTATATSGDVRGTYGLQSSSNGVLRLVVHQRPLPPNVKTTAGLTGVLNYSS